MPSTEHVASKNEICVRSNVEDQEAGMLRDGNIQSQNSWGPLEFETEEECERPHPPYQHMFRELLAGCMRVILIGEVAIVICTIIYSCQAVIAKVVEKSIPSLELVFVRSFIAGCATLYGSVKSVRKQLAEEEDQKKISNGVGHIVDSGIGGGFQARPKSLQHPGFSWISALLGGPDIRYLCAARGVLGSIAFALFYAAYPLLTIAEHVSIQFLYPCVVLLFAWPVLGERPAPVSILTVVCGVGGTLLVVRPAFLFPHDNDDSSDESGEEARRFQGIVLCVTGALFSGVTMVLVRLVGSRVSSFVLATWFHGCSCVLGAVAMAAGLQPAVLPTPTDAALLLLVSATAFFGQLSLNYSYQVLPAARAAALSYLQILWGFVLSTCFLGEAFTLSGVAGGALIAAGGIAGKVCKSESPNPPPTRAKSSSSSSSSSNNIGSEEEVVEKGGRVGNPFSDDSVGDEHLTVSGLLLEPIRVMSVSEVKEGEEPRATPPSTLHFPALASIPMGARNDAHSKRCDRSGGGKFVEPVRKSFQGRISGGTNRRYLPLESSDQNDHLDKDTERDSQNNITNEYDGTGT